MKNVLAPREMQARSMSAFPIPSTPRPKLAAGRDALLHTSEAAKLLRVSPAWLARHRWAGTGIPYIKVGKRAVRYRLSDIQAWIESHAVHSQH